MKKIVVTSLIVSLNKINHRMEFSIFDSIEFEFLVSLFYFNQWAIID